MEKLVAVLLMMVAIPTLGLLTMGLTTTTITAHAAAACPDPGQCTCNSASGVMTDHAMASPFNRINNGCTNADAPSELPSSGSSSDNGGSSSDNGGSSSDNGGSSSNDGG